MNNNPYNEDAIREALFKMTHKRTPYTGKYVVFGRSKNGNNFEPFEGEIKVLCLSRNKLITSSLTKLVAISNSLIDYHIYFSMIQIPAFRCCLRKTDKHKAFFDIIGIDYSGYDPKEIIIGKLAQVQSETEHDIYYFGVGVQGESSIYIAKKQYS